MEKPDVASRLHRLGTGLGIACAIHCLAMPLVVGVLPLVGLGVLAEESTETWLVSIAVVITAASALWGFHKHRALRILMTLFGALGMMLLGLWMGHGNPLGLVLSITGALAIAAAHLWGARLCKTCPNPAEGDHDHGHDHHHGHDHGHGHHHPGHHHG